MILGGICMDMVAYTRNIRDILNLSKKYVIPRFQREYSWGEDELKTLFNDITDKINLNSEGGLFPEEYFIGSLVLVGDDASDTEFLVVDGQQRLTTITIILSVLTELFLNRGDEGLAKAVHKYIVGEDDNGEKFYKLENESPKPFFQLRIQEYDKTQDREPTGDEEELLLQAYKYLSEQLKENNLRRKVEKDKKYEGDYISLLKAVRDQVLAFKTIYITVNDKDTAYTIFETLNAKGKDLDAVDLIKNKIFQIIDTETPIDKARVYWKDLKATLYSREERVSLASFFRHFWISKYGVVVESKLYEEFLKRIPKLENEYISFLGELDKASEWYIKIVSPSESDWRRQEDKVIYESLIALNIFGTTQTRTIILALFDGKYDRKVISEKVLLKAMKAIEHFHFMFTAITSSRPSGLEHIYSKYARLLRASENRSNSAQVIDEMIGQLKEKLPTYEAFEERYIKLSWTSKFTKHKKLINYILKKMENSYRTTGELDINIPSIEHILSQSSEEKYVGQIGNLLPLDAGVNNEMGNCSFGEKINYLALSELLTVQKFIEEYKENSVWDEAEINQRSKDMAKKSYEIWSIVP